MAQCGGGRAGPRAPPGVCSLSSCRPQRCAVPPCVLGSRLKQLQNAESLPWGLTLCLMCVCWAGGEMDASISG